MPVVWGSFCKPFVSVAVHLKDSSRALPLARLKSWVCYSGGCYCPSKSGSMVTLGSLPNCTHKPLHLSEPCELMACLPCSWLPAPQRHPTGTSRARAPHQGRACTRAWTGCHRTLPASKQAGSASERWCMRSVLQRCWQEPAEVYWSTICDVSAAFCSSLCVVECVLSWRWASLGPAVPPVLW